MRLLFQVSLVSLSLLGVADAFPQKTSCSSLLSANKAHEPVQILTANNVQPGSLNASSGYSSVQNTFSLCQVQGIIKYQANSKTGKIESNVNGNDTLTWELFLPNLQSYNGRFLAVGKRQGQNRNFFRDYDTVNRLS